MKDPEISRLLQHEYQAEYRRKNPEKAQQWRINSAIRFLTKLGYTITPPDVMTLDAQTAQEERTKADTQTAQEERTKADTQTVKPEVSPAALAKREYKKRWARNNPDKIKAAQQRYWEKKARQILGSDPEA